MGYGKACALIRNTDWKIILTSNLNESWQNWKKIFLDIMQQCVPRAKQQCRRYLLWINKNIMCAIKRDHLYRKFKISQSVSAWKKYKEMRNRVVKLIRSSRAVFFSNLSRMANDPQKFLENSEHFEHCFKSYSYTGF